MKIKSKPIGHLLSSAVITGLFTSSLIFTQNSLAGGIISALEAGKPVLDVRLRAETVDQTPKSDKATAITARTRVGYKSGDYLGLKGYFEFENIAALIDDYNSTANGKTKFPVVADPEGSEVNQAFLTYTGVNGLLLKAGRQRIILDNARFVGNVGWRQNEQTFDAALINTTAVKGLSASYAFVNQVNGITGGADKTDTHLINASYKGLPNTKITAYAYLIDMEAGAKGDNKTLGASINGKYPINSSVKILYAGEFAQMSDFADNSSGTTANYYLVELGAAVKKASVKLGYEVLGGDGTTSFSTPLATKHKFNGWADMFLATPKDGLVDTYLTAVGKVSGIKLLATYHMFSSDNGGENYGSEIDLLAAKKFAKHYSVGIKYAKYMEGDLATKKDTNKFWLWGGISF